MSSNEESPRGGMNEVVVGQIRAEMARRHMTQQQLAERSGLSDSSVVRYLNLQRPMKIGTIDVIARALGMDWETLIQRAMAEGQQ